MPFIASPAVTKLIETKLVPAWNQSRYIVYSLEKILAHMYRGISFEKEYTVLSEQWQLFKETSAVDIQELARKHKEEFVFDKYDKPNLDQATTMATTVTPDPTLLALLQLILCFKQIENNVSLINDKHRQDTFTKGIYKDVYKYIASVYFKKEVAKRMDTWLKDVTPKRELLFI